MEDFETFYMRNTGILPKFQNKDLYKIFLNNFIKYIKKIGYQRISRQHNCTNSRIISLKMTSGFIIVGSENHDRWGTLIKLVKFLEPKRDKLYKNTF